MKNVLLALLLSFSAWVSAQEKDKTLPVANEAYDQKNYSDAEADYRISKSKFPNRSVAAYNLGNSIYRQNQGSEAKFAYNNALKNAKTKTQKHKILHNLGNVFMKEKNYGKAVEAYKEALKNDPTDDETRYNFALAKKMQKDNPEKNDPDKKNKDQKNDQKSPDKDKNKDQNQNKDQEDKNGDNKEKNDNNNNNNDPNKNKPNQNNGQPKPNPGGISQDRVQNLLDAVNNEEKKIQEKVNAKKGKGNPVRTEKDW